MASDFDCFVLLPLLSCLVSESRSESKLSVGTIAARIGRRVGPQAATMPISTSTRFQTERPVRIAALC